MCFFGLWEKADRFQCEKGWGDFPQRRGNKGWGRPEVKRKKEGDENWFKKTVKYDDVTGRPRYFALEKKIASSLFHFCSIARYLESFSTAFMTGVDISVPSAMDLG
jgi:hypothetical protein